MSYCRFENTYKDLVDCIENIVYVADGFDENYRQLMIDLFATVAERYDGDIVGYAQNETFD